METKNEIFECKIHGADYRICCEECQGKYARISEVVLKGIMEAKKKTEQESK